MNKYQEALNILFIGCTDSFGFRPQSEKDMIQELINKQTKHKTLEELGFKCIEHNVYVKFSNINTESKRIEFKFSEVELIGKFDFEQLKAIELKMMDRKNII